MAHLNAYVATLSASAVLAPMNRTIVQWGKLFHGSSLVKFQSNSLFCSSTQRSRHLRFVSSSMEGKNLGSKEVSQEEAMTSYSWPDNNVQINTYHNILLSSVSITTLYIQCHYQDIVH